jgi:hypothetical protein
MITACACCNVETEEKYSEIMDQVTLDYDFCKECLMEIEILIKAGEEALLSLGKMEQILKISNS